MRNYGMTSRKTMGAHPSSGSHYSAQPRADLNSQLAVTRPPAPPRLVYSLAWYARQERPSTLFPLPCGSLIRDEAPLECGQLPKTLRDKLLVCGAFLFCLAGGLAFPIGLFIMIFG